MFIFIHLLQYYDMNIKILVFYSAMDEEWDFTKLP